jgi:histidyl-tRNA synthetase
LKPKLPQQYKAAEQGNIPSAIILGKEELAAGKRRIKEMDFTEGHTKKKDVEGTSESLVLEPSCQEVGGELTSLAQRLQGLAFLLLLGLGLRFLLLCLA